MNRLNLNHFGGEKKNGEKEKIRVYKSTKSGPQKGTKSKKKEVKKFIETICRYVGNYLGNQTEGKLNDSKGKTGNNRPVEQHS